MMMILMIHCMRTEQEPLKFLVTRAFESMYEGKDNRHFHPGIYGFENLTPNFFDVNIVPVFHT